MEDEERANLWQGRKVECSSVCNFFCCSRGEILKPVFWLLYQKPQQRYWIITKDYWNPGAAFTFQNNIQRIQTSNSQRAAAVRSGKLPWQLLQHPNKDCSLSPRENYWTLYATRCTYLGEVGFLLYFIPTFKISVLLKEGVSSLHSRNSLQSKMAKHNSPKPGCM